MPIPRSVWWVGALMVVMMLALLEGLASTAPDPRPVVDLRAVRLTPKPLAPAAGPVWLATLPQAAANVAPWSSAAQSRPLPGLQPALAQPACRTCGVVESVKPLQAARVTTAAAAAVPDTASLDAHASGMRPGASPAPRQTVGEPAALSTRAGRGTVYRVRVRMDDGSLRTLTQRSAPIIGARVIVAGRTLRPARNDPAVLLGA